MPSPIVFEVCPAGSGWVVRIAGDSMWELFDDKKVAIARARELMSREPYARTRVLGETGEVESEYPESRH
jgi:hypothetical protein